MKLIKSFYLSLIVSILLIQACSPKLDVQLYHQADDSVDAAQYHTFEYYGWAENSDKLLTLMEKNKIEHSFGKEFKTRNLSLVEEKGDLIVTLFIVTEEKTETKATTYATGGVSYGGYGGYGYGGYGSYYGYGPGYGWGTGMGTSTVYTQEVYKAGSLIIDIYDAKKEELIYEAIVTQEKSEGQIGKEERLLDLVTRSMMYNFQVKPVGKK
jgi:hypothetical protein